MLGHVNNPEPAFHYSPYKPVATNDITGPVDLNLRREYRFYSVGRRLRRPNMAIPPHPPLASVANVDILVPVGILRDVARSHTATRQQSLPLFGAQSLE